MIGDTLSFTEGDGLAAIDQSGDALVSDVDSSNFDGGMLSVSLGSGSDPAEDILRIRSMGTLPGDIGFNAGVVTYGGIVIGTATGGTGGTDLNIALNANADAAAVSALIQNIGFTNSDSQDPTTGIRSVEFGLMDGDGATSISYVAWVEVNPQNDAPTLDNNSNFALTDIAEDANDPAGETVANILGSSGTDAITDVDSGAVEGIAVFAADNSNGDWQYSCLLYTSPSPRDKRQSRMPSSA